jgi:hypothetical protein
MGEYTSFIEKIKGSNFRGTNFIEYNDLGGEIYISFQVLLYFLEEYINLGSKGKSVIKIDWESDKPFYAFSTSISTNLKKCYLYNNYIGTTDGSITEQGVATFQSFTTFKNNKFQKINDQLKKDSGNPTSTAIFPQVGNINYVYLNVGYLSTIINKENTSTDNGISIKKFLQTICDDINKALGGINDFQATTDPDENIVTIIDFNQKRIKGLSPGEDQLTTLKVQGLGSFVTSVSAQSSITPEIATMISVGAQANGNQIGEEATSFSRLSEGLEDRIYPEKKIKNSPEIKISQKENTGFESTLSAYKELITFQKELVDSKTKISITSDDKSNVENVPVDLYKICLGAFTKTNQSSTSFIPIKLDLTLSGISGLKIFQRFNISSDILPYTYKDNYNFITTGVSHEVNNNNQWLTKISSLIALKEQPLVSNSSIFIPLPIDDEASSLSPIDNAGGGSYTPENVPASIDKCKALKGELNEKIVKSKIKNVYGGFVEGKESFITKLEKAYDNLLKQGITLSIGDSLRSYEFQRSAYIKNEADKKAGKKVPNKAHPCNGYHVRGQAFDLAQSLAQKEDIITHGKIYKALYDVGLRRIPNEWWHWSLGEFDHEINKKFSGNSTSPADKDNYTRY